MTCVADEVILDNGSRIVGDIQDLIDGKVTLKTDFSEDMTIETGQIKGISTDKPMTVQLNGGDRAVGVLRYSDQEGQRVKSNGVGDVKIDLGGVSGIWAGGKESPEVVAMREALAKNPWSIKLHLGIDGQTGNTDRFSINGRMDILRKTEGERLLIFAAGRHTHENNNDTIKEILGGFRLEVDVDDRWFAFGKLGLEFDEFENLDLRTTVSGGFGYFVIKEAKTEFKVRVGVGFKNESFNTGVSDDQAVAELGWDFMREFTRWLLFTHEATIFPSFEDTKDFRLVVENAAEIPINGDQNWKIRIGVRNDYDAMPEPGIERLDTYYFMNVVWRVN